jgi:hypothetical protein
MIGIYYGSFISSCRGMERWLPILGKNVRWSDGQMYVCVFFKYLCYREQTSAQKQKCQIYGEKGTSLIGAIFKNSTC